MTINLIDKAWIPVRRQSGRVECIIPHQIVETDDPPIDLASPRPDFDGALAQFLIGLLQTCFAPACDEEWAEHLEEPPNPGELSQAFAKVHNAFNVDGNGPRFMQDFDNLEAKPKPIGSLLIEAPGDQTLRHNADHFIKRDYIKGLCPTCTATALFALQINAPSGGAGHRTSLRGGGPLTTLVRIDPEGSGLAETLWRNLWLNVLPREVRLTGDSNKTDAANIFPWLVQTRTSHKGEPAVMPQDTNPLQMYWCMPRRIRLDWEHVDEGACNICGEHTTRRVLQYVTVNYGINYEGPWRHPLSPYVHAKGKAHAMHPQPGGLTYRHWPGLVYRQDQDGNGVEPAQVVEEFQKRPKEQGEQFLIWAFGYDMDNMKARCWYDHSLPLYLISAAIREDFIVRVNRIIEAAQYAAKQTSKRVKEAWFKRPGDTKGDASFVADEFYHRTEDDFYTTVDTLVEALPKQQELTALHRWHRTIRKAGLALFDEWVLSAEIAWSDPRRIATARAALEKDLNRNNKKLKQALQLDAIEEEAA